MKSSMKETGWGDGFAGDTIWMRVELEIDELYDAIINDDLTAFIRRVMRPYVGEMLSFESIVADVARSARLLIVDRLRRSTEGTAMVVLFSDNDVRKREATYCHRVKVMGFHESHPHEYVPAYWRGEPFK